MKKYAYLGAILYLLASLYVIFTNANNNLSEMASGKFLVFSLISIFVFGIIVKVIKEINQPD
jgi:hypothetical protein